MTPTAYIATLATAEAKAEAVDRWITWYMWDTETEYSPEDEQEYNRMVYTSIALDIEINGWQDYTQEDLENYRTAAQAA